MTVSRANIQSMLSGVVLDTSSDEPLRRQLAAGLRALLRSGELPAGTRLPPSRDLASLLRVSRGTVTEAFEALSAEGFLQATVGRGTFVRSAGSPPQPERVPPRTSARAARLAAERLPSTAHLGPGRAFRVGMPDLRLFPWVTWSRLEARLSRRRVGAPGYDDPAGYGPLRDAIAAYLNASRGLRCVPEQVIVTSGSQQALDLAARALLDQGEEIALEDPGYFGARLAFLGAGLAVTPVSLDSQGLSMEALVRQAPGARAVYVTPSHQYPTGVAMDAERRMALLAWAARRGAWIIEDDYDSEYRYAGARLTPLQALDHESQVIYVGTFSKVLFPGLRLGYLVVPTSLARLFRAVKTSLDLGTPSFASAVLAAFISEGHFGRHLRRTRQAYAARHAALMAQQTLFGDALQLSPSQSGLHLIGHCPPGVEDCALARRAARRGVDVEPLSAHAMQAQLSGLTLGFAVATPAEIVDAAQRLAGALHDPE